MPEEQQHRTLIQVSAAPNVAGNKVNTEQNGSFRQFPWSTKCRNASTAKPAGNRPKRAVVT